MAQTGDPTRQIDQDDVRGQDKPQNVQDKGATLAEYPVAESPSAALMQVDYDHVMTRQQLLDTSNPASGFSTPAMIGQILDANIDGGSTDDIRRAGLQPTWNLDKTTNVATQNASTRTRLSALSERGVPDGATTLQQQATALRHF